MRIDLKTKQDDCESLIGSQRPAWREAGFSIIFTIAKAMHSPIRLAGRKKVLRSDSQTVNIVNQFNSYINPRRIPYYREETNNYL
jgi:hypothetical protein